MKNNLSISKRIKFAILGALTLGLFILYVTEMKYPDIFAIDFDLLYFVLFGIIMIALSLPRLIRSVSTFKSEGFYGFIFSNFVSLIMLFIGALALGTLIFYSLYPPVPKSEAEIRNECELDCLSGKYKPRTVNPSGNDQAVCVSTCMLFQALDLD